MTTTPNNESLPDGISMADLKSMMDKAKNNPADKSVDEPTFGDLNEAQVIKLAQELLDAGDEKCPHPLLAKVMMMIICERMIAWHTASGEHISEESNSKDETYVHWLRDAGKFQSIYLLLESITVCDGDFTYQNPSRD